MSNIHVIYKNMEYGKMKTMYLELKILIILIVNHDNIVNLYLQIELNMWGIIVIAGSLYKEFCYILTFYVFYIIFFIKLSHESSDRRKGNVYEV